MTLQVPCKKKVHNHPNPVGNMIKKAILIRNRIIESYMMKTIITLSDF